MIMIDKALQIPGWMNEEELTWLAKTAAKSSCIAEIGSWRGRSARAMADNTDGMIVCVDPWSDDSIGYGGWWTAQEDRTKYGRKDWLLKEFQANLADHIGHKVFMVRDFSANAIEKIRMNMVRFDMIFIDGSHDFGHVCGDILMWWSLLKPGGVFCGHDYGEPTCPEVAPAVNRFVGKVEVVAGTIWRAV
jgi:predicted O-methyltransferase YrrM